MSDINDKSFKEGMRDLLINTMDSGGSCTFGDNKLTLKDDTEVVFDIVIKIKEVKIK